MSEKQLPKRLAKVATEFNQSLDTILEFLKTKGFTVERNPNVKLSDEIYKLLSVEFSESKLLKIKAEEELTRLKDEEISERTKIENEKNTYYGILVGSILELELTAKHLPDKLIFKLENGMIGALHVSELDWDYSKASSCFKNVQTGDILKVKVLEYNDVIHEFILGRKFGKQQLTESNEWKNLILMEETDAVVIGEYKDNAIIALNDKLFGSLPLVTVKHNKYGAIIRVIPIIKNESNYLVECVPYDELDKLFYLTQGKYRNNELIGDKHFDNAINSLVGGDFNIAYEELIMGFKKVSCDCTLVGLIEKNKDQINLSFDTKTVNCTTKKLDFLRAVIYFFNDEFDSALACINLHLNEPWNEIGEYLKGRILAGLGKFDESILVLKYPSDGDWQEIPARLFYRLGRMKEEHSDESGLANLWQSVIDNPSSLCAHRWLKITAEKHKVKLQTNSEKLLVNLFNSADTEVYLNTLNQFLKKGYIDFSNGSRLTTSDVFSEFLDSLYSDKTLFGIQYDDYEHDTRYIGDYEESQYAGSYAHDVAGLDDDFINDVLEGDPMNYWNID